MGWFLPDPKTNPLGRFFRLGHELTNGTENCLYLLVMVSQMPFQFLQLSGEFFM
jgi:hypothetical protein